MAKNYTHKEPWRRFPHASYNGQRGWLMFNRAAAEFFRMRDFRYVDLVYSEKTKKLYIKLTNNIHRSVYSLRGHPPFKFRIEMKKFAEQAGVAVSETVTCPVEYDRRVGRLVINFNKGRKNNGTRRKSTKSTG